MDDRTKGHGRTTKADRKVLREELEEVRRKHKGVLRAEDTVEAARDPRKRLHREFNWDDAECGRIHRLDQARALIASFEIEYTYQEFKFKAPAYGHDPRRGPNQQGYVALSEIRSNEEVRRDMATRELRSATFAVARAVNIARYFGLHKEVERIQRELTKAIEKIAVAKPIKD